MPSTWNCEGAIQEFRRTQLRIKRKLSAVRLNAVHILTRVLRKWREGILGSCIGEWLSKIAGDRLYAEFERTNALHREQAEEKAAMIKAMRDKEKALRRREKAVEAAYSELGVGEPPTAGHGGAG